MKKIIFSFILIFVNLIFTTNSQAFLYGAIYSLNSINIAKTNGIELSPPYNSRTYCLISQRKYNHYFKEYIRSTCFQKEDDNDRFYYLVCPKSFETCDVSKYLGAALNEEELKGNIGNNNLFNSGSSGEKNNITKDDILNKLNDIFNLQKNTQFSYNVSERYNSVKNSIQKYLDKNNPETNKRLYEFLDRIYNKYSGKADLDIKKLYTIETMKFIDDEDDEVFTLQDLLAHRIDKKSLDKVYSITLIVRDAFGIKYSIDLKFNKNAILKGNNDDYDINTVIKTIFEENTGNDYDIGEVIKGIFMDDSGNDYDIEKVIKGVFMDDSGNEYNIEDVIKTIFEENIYSNNNSDDTSSDSSTPEYTNSNTTNINVGGDEQELSIQDIMNMVFKEE